MRGARLTLSILGILGWVLVGVIAPGVAVATTTRVRCLGGAGDYLEDLANVLQWYGSLVSYGDVAVLELGRIGEDQSQGSGARRQTGWQGMGAHVDLDPEGRVGTFGLYLEDGPPGESAAGEIAMLFGRGLGDRGQVGVMLGLDVVDGGDSGADALVVEDLLRGVRLGLGGRCDLGSETYLDAAGELRGAHVRYLDRLEAPLIFDSDRWRSFALRSRLFWEPRPGLALVPLISYTREDRPTSSVAAAPMLFDAWQLRAGLGVNLLPGPDLLGLIACEYRRQRQRFYAPLRRDLELPDAATELRESMGSDANSLLVIHAGLEARLLSWLTLRGGAFAAPTAREQVADFGSLRAIDAFDLSVGLGIHVGDLDVDVLFNDDAPFNFGSLLTNAGGGEVSTFSGMTVIYRF